MQNVLRDSTFVNKVSSAIVEGVKKRQYVTRKWPSQTAPTEEEAIVRILESMHMQVLGAMRTQLLNVESVRNEMPVLNTFSAQVHLLKTQVTGVQHRVEDVATELALMKTTRMSGGSRHQAKVANVAHDPKEDSENARLPSSEARRLLR